MKNPLKKEYLNLYKEKGDGGYVFTGTYYRFTGEHFKTRFTLLTLVLCAIGAVIVASGCLNAAGMQNSYYVIFPYIGEVSAFFALAWNAFKLLGKGKVVKEYIYKTAYPRLPKIAIALAVLSGISLICSIVFIILNGPEGGVAKCVLYNVFKIMIVALSIVFRQLILKTEYAVE